MCFSAQWVRFFCGAMSPQRRGANNPCLTFVEGKEERIRILILVLGPQEWGRKKCSLTAVSTTDSPWFTAFRSV